MGPRAGLDGCGKSGPPPPPGKLLEILTGLHVEISDNIRSTGYLLQVWGKVCRVQWVCDNVGLTVGGEAQGAEVEHPAMWLRSLCASS